MVLDLRKGENVHHRNTYIYTYKHTYIQHLSHNHSTIQPRESKTSPLHGLFFCYFLATFLPTRPTTDYQRWSPKFISSQGPWAGYLRVSTMAAPKHKYIKEIDKIIISDMLFYMQNNCNPSHMTKLCKTVISFTTTKSMCGNKKNFSSRR